MRSSRQKSKDQNNGVKTGSSSVKTMSEKRLRLTELKEQTGVKTRSSSVKTMSEKKLRLTRSTELNEQTDVRIRSSRVKPTSGERLPRTRSTEMKQQTGCRTRLSKVKSISGEDPPRTKETKEETGYRTRSSKMKSIHKKKSPRMKSTEMKEQTVQLEVDDVISQFYKPVDDHSLKQEECTICCEKLSNSSPYSNVNTVISLQNCHHNFHLACLKAMYNSGTKDGHLQCPTCKTIYGIKKGNQPKGTMNSHVIPCSLPGYPAHDTICITYNIHPGTQGPEHIRPGRKYTAHGFPRVCYLPNNDKGRKVLHLLEKAWERRLIFTIGVSATTGEEDTVTWNEIHHKTEFMSNYTGHGWPDPQYLDNVLMELALQGVME